MAKYATEENSNIGELVRKMEDDFTSGTTTISKYVDFSLSEDINKIYAYLESKHTMGDVDSMEREKPFFNIVLARRNIWYRATDIDRSNIKIKATKSSDDTAAFLATVHLQDWMRRENFGKFLNNWGINSAGFNETVLKFVEQKGRLIPSVVPWNRIICDAIDFKNNPKVEVIELTEAQLRQKKEYDQKIVEKLCAALSSRETLEKQRKDNKSNYIRLYEVHGELPLSYLTGKDSDADEYIQQMQVITFVASNEEGKFDDFTLFSGREANDPYMLVALLPEVDGSIALRGSVKNLFDAQWMMNHTVKSIKDQLDLASMLFFQTSDGTFVGQNALSAMQNGDILIHKVNEPLTKVDNSSHDLTSLQSFGQMWQVLSNEIDGVSDSMLGNTAPSGTAWRQVNQLLQENHSLFELMTENRGLDIEEVLRTYVIPFLKKKMNNAEEVTATLKAHDISKVDSKYVKNRATTKTNAKIKEKTLNGQVVTPEEQAMMSQDTAQQTQEGLNTQGNQRFFAPDEVDWKTEFKDLEWDVQVDITGENVDKDAATTLTTLLDFFQKKGGTPLSPNEKMVVNKLLELSGVVSPLEIADIQAPPPQAPVNKVSESISFKDLPPEGKVQMAGQAGIKINTPPPDQPVAPNGGGAPVGSNINQLTTKQ